MKFARYLQDAQTTEWKKAYIDYRGLKVQLEVIRAQALQQAYMSHHAGPTNSDRSLAVAPNNNEPEVLEDRRMAAANATSPRTGTLARNGATASRSYLAAFSARRGRGGQERPSLTIAVASLAPRVAVTTSTAPSQQTPLPPRTPRSPPIFPFFRESAGTPTPPPLHIILANLPPSHALFFDMLKAELEKVETFYAEREKEMQERAKKLREQLNELRNHRQMIRSSSTRSKTRGWTKKGHLSVPPGLLSWLQGPNTQSELALEAGTTGILASESSRGGDPISLSACLARLRSVLGQRQRNFVDNVGAEEVLRPSGDHARHMKTETGEKSVAEASEAVIPEDTKSPPKRSNSIGTKYPLDPLEYQHAKKRLRKAVIEHYRGLEVLNNYRILNLTGFRKALKKYEKITKNFVMEAYMKEKVEPSAFASGAMVSTMLKEMEDLFAKRFEQGDRKRAIDRLRVGPFSKTHHFSTFRSGIWLGLAVPAIAGGTYLSFQENVRASLSSWNILLFIYSIFLVPVLLALLIGINIAVWAREKINYVFIFDLNPRTRLDQHEYFELPSFFLCTLALAYWFSLSQIGPPLLWPLVWIALVFAVMSNPVRHFLWGSTRWWIIKNTAKLGASGVWKVEFTDFWLGDQFCSLSYSLSNLVFVGCFYTNYFPQFVVPVGPTLTQVASSVYATRFVNTTMPNPLEPYSATSVLSSLTSSTYDPQVQEAWTTCGVARNWGWHFLLGASPLLVRFVQSLRRYWDSKLPTHLINAGKYGMGMIAYFFYMYWKHQETPRAGASYILWCFTASVYSIYACTWDVLMDWSFCKPHAQYPLLRRELIFKTQISSYYCALISNLCLRFSWLAYVPARGLNPTERTFIVAILEMLRRVQWNFYRLENEHLGNIDQYRVTREIPLPYSLEMQSPEYEEEQEQEGEGEGEPVSAGDEPVEPMEEGTRELAWWRTWRGRSRRNGGPTGHG